MTTVFPPAAAGPPTPSPRRFLCTDIQYYLYISATLHRVKSQMYVCMHAASSESHPPPPPPSSLTSSSSSSESSFSSSFTVLNCLKHTLSHLIMSSMLCFGTLPSCYLHSLLLSLLLLCTISSSPVLADSWKDRDGANTIIDYETDEFSGHVIASISFEGMSCSPS
jgi:hypothetical protein